MRRANGRNAEGLGKIMTQKHPLALVHPRAMACAVAPQPAKPADARIQEDSRAAASVHHNRTDTRGTDTTRVGKSWHVAGNRIGVRGLRKQKRGLLVAGRGMMPRRRESEKAQSMMSAASSDRGRRSCRKITADGATVTTFGLAS